MTYILIQAFIKSPLQLLRLPGLIIFWLKYRMATTPRQKNAVWKDTHLKYGTNVSHSFSLSFCQAPMLPLVKQHAHPCSGNMTDE